MSCDHAPKKKTCEAVSGEMKSKIFSLALCLPAAAGALRRNQASWSFRQLKANHISMDTFERTHIYTLRR